MIQNKLFSKLTLRWQILLLLLLIVAGAGLIIFQSFRLQKKFLNISQQLNYLNLSSQQQIQNSTRNKLVIAQLSRKLSQNEKAWMLPEIKTLIWRANILLTIEHNVPTTLTLLKTADAYLQHLHDPALSNLHTLLNQDITTLQALPKVEIPKIYMRIQKLSDQIKKIPLIDKHAVAQKSTAQKTPPTKTTQPIWKRFFTGTWDVIKTFLVIRHHQQAIQPLLTFQQHQIIVIKLQILCAQAQWALLQRRNKLYHNILQQIQQSIKNHFLQSSNYTAAVMDELSNLQKINIDFKPPPLNNALQEVKSQILKTAREK